LTAVQQTIPLATPDLRGREAEYLLQCVRDNWVSSAGPFVTEAETRIAALVGVSHAVATVNGTAALHLALVGVGVKPGSKVVVPDWTFVATANAVSHCGAEPFLVDVTAESWSLDPVLVADVLCRPGHGIAAVIAVDSLGHPADFDSLREVCRNEGVALIEDAAGAIGASYKSRRCGGLADIGTFSFNGNKTVTAGGGGMVLTNDEAMARHLRLLSAQARGGTEYKYNGPAWNYRMPNLNAAVLLAQLERLDEMLAIKRRIADRYDCALRGRNDLVPMPRQPWAQSGCWHYGVLTGGEDDAKSLLAHMDAHAIEARIFWRSLSDQKPWCTAARHLNGVSQSLSGKVVVLPCSTHITDGELDRVAAALKSFRGAQVVEARWT
jgi:dTDP-4-amino-4,6-dideoxygalactose transaminase